MIAAYATLRALGLLRRAARALERDRELRARADLSTVRPRRPTEYSTLDVDEAERRWRVERVALGLVDEED